MLTQKLIMKLIITILWLLFMTPAAITFVRKHQPKLSGSDVFL